MYCVRLVLSVRYTFLCLMPGRNGERRFFPVMYARPVMNTSNLQCILLWMASSLRYTQTEHALIPAGEAGHILITSCGRELICGARMESQTSNVEMEIKAVIMALRRIAGSRPEYILVCTDYLDLVRCMAGRSRIKPSDSRFFLFRELREAARSFRCPVYWKWVKGHSGNKFNSLCDQRLRRILPRIV